MIKIAGSGMAGLLCANVLRRMNPVIHEAKKELPNSHAALLRFRTDVVSKATGIPFKKVVVNKDVSWQHATFCEGKLAMNNAYAFKVTGKIANRSILNLESGERFIAPSDFISQMAKSVEIHYDSPLTEQEISERNEQSPPLISTLPMPVMMKMTKWNEIPKFEWRKIWSVRCVVKDCDVYQTIYYPSRKDPYYRASITGNLLIVEYIEQPDTINSVGQINGILQDFGINQKPESFETVMQEYGKLMPVEPETCRRFILWLTDKYRIYSLGRFATWRQILLDSVVNDIEVIKRLIEYRGGYETKIEQSK